MIQGINTSKEPTTTFSQYTGLGQVTLKKVNPTSEEFEAITGYPRNMTYNAIGDNNLKPVRILVHNESAGYQVIDFLLGNTPQLSSTGKTQFVSTKGNFSWGVDEAAITSNPNMAWFGEISRPAFIGEESLVSFFKQGLGIDKDTLFLDELVNKVGYNPANIYNGNVVSLDSLVKIFNDNAMTMIVPFGVKETMTDTGATRNYQNIITKNNCFYHMASMNYAKKQFKKMLATQEAAGYPIKLATSIEFQEFTGESPAVAQADDATEIKPITF